MVNYLHKRLKSERGASLSFALFLALVCAAVCSIVLAAATASSGQFAKLGQFDQRYYSVSSAAGLFQSELDSNGQVSYPFTEVSSFSREERSGEADTQVDLTITKPDNRPSSTNNKLSFLYGITEYALYGQNGAGANPAKPFDPTWWDSAVGSKGYQTITYSVTPSISGSSNMNVDVEARLHDDWSVEVVLSSQATDPKDAYSLYLVFAGNLEDSTSTSQSLGDTQVAGSVTNDVDTTKTRTLNVTWRLRQVVPGRGFAND